MVAHSHNDVGWINTPDEYFEEKVNKILTSVVQALIDNPKRKFSQVEMYYFERWWKIQPSEVQDAVYDLVEEGRLEFINGGWVAHDEACTTYEDIILNMLLGHSFLNKTFGKTPKHAWQADAFGHSAATPELFKRMGFESLFFARADSSDIENRKKT